MDKKLIIISLLIVLILSGVLYLFFALIPFWTKLSLPTGGWDWLGYVGTIVGLLISVWGVITTLNENSKSQNKQRQEAVIPCLYIDSYMKFNGDAKNNVFRILEDNIEGLINNGFILIRDNSKQMPKGFSPSCNLKISNLGLSTAFSISAYIYDLTAVDGLTNISEIEKRTIPDFYKKIRIKNFSYFEDDKLKANEWIISPVFNLCNKEDEYNLVFDFSRIKNAYHTIIEFRFQDIYENKYHQLMYLYFDSKRCMYMPISHVIKKESINAF